MTSDSSSDCNTLLVDIKILIDSLTENQLMTFYNSVFALKTTQGVNFVSVLQHHGKGNIFRYDPNIMTPHNSSAKIANEIIYNFISETKPTTIKWTGSNVLLLDNWRFLHKRNECKNETNRVLKRIYINL